MLLTGASHMQMVKKAWGQPNAIQSPQVLKEPHLQGAAGPGLEDGPTVKLSSIVDKTQILHPRGQVTAANTTQHFIAGRDAIMQQLLLAHGSID